MTSDAPSTSFSALRDEVFKWSKHIRSKIPNEGFSLTSYGASIGFSGISALLDELLVTSSLEEFRVISSALLEESVVISNRHEARESLIVIDLWWELIELVNYIEQFWVTARQRQRAFPLSELHRDILYELLLSVEMSETKNMRSYLTRPRIQFNRERLKMLKKMYGTCSDPRIYVVTQNLARSESALDNLAELLEGAKKNSVEKTVLPIFYGVDPSDVRHQTGSFAQAFADHEIKYKDDPQKVKRWKAALTKLANLAGWDSKGWHETKLIQEVVDEIRWNLYSPFSKPAIRNLPSTPSWSSSYGRKHDVFLSFRGADTRLTFMGHLHAALNHRGISTFRDDIDLEKGKSIRKQLDKAIEGSKVWVVIVSPDYASSKWCLNELVKIIECRKASKVGKKNETLMKPFAEYEEQAHTLVNGDKTHKGKASLRNKENITNHNKREMGEFRLGVKYGGKWVGSVYIGGETKEIVVSEDITYNELLHQLYHIVGVHPNENEIKISTIDESKSPAYPVEIINDDDLKNFIDQSISSDMHLKHPLPNSSGSRSIEVRVLVNHDGVWVNSTYVGGKTKGIIISEDITYQELANRVYGVVGVDPNEYKLIMKTAYKSNLPTQPVEIIDDEGVAFFIHDENLSLGMSSIFSLCTTLERRAFPSGRMESSHSGTTHMRRFGTYSSCVHCVTPDQVPHLHTQVGPYIVTECALYAAAATTFLPAATTFLPTDDVAALLRALSTILSATTASVPTTSSFLHAAAAVSLPTAKSFLHAAAVTNSSYALLAQDVLE